MLNPDSGAGMCLWLLADWTWVATKAWSAWLPILVALLLGFEALKSVFLDSAPIPRATFAILFFIITAAAFAARLIAQR